MADSATTARQRRKPRREPSPTTPDPIEIAMEAEAGDRSPDSPARGLLVDQRRLVRWQIASERMGVALKFLTGAAGLAVAVALGLMAWSASRADGLVIKPFTVPPGMAARGITGEALASDLIERLNEMSTVARSAEAQRRVAAEWGQNISISIPETGVSLSQIDQWLRDKFGHERRVTGELRLNPDGSLMLASRTGPVGLARLAGSEADLPSLLQQTAEALYAQEQPSSYGRYLRIKGRTPDALAHARRRIASGSPRDKALGYADLGILLRSTEGTFAARSAYQRSITFDPEASHEALTNLANIEGTLGHTEAAQAIRIRLRKLLNDGAYSYLSPAARRQQIFSVNGSLNGGVGDYSPALALASKLSREDLLGYGTGTSFVLTIATVHASLHDVARAEAIVGDFQPENEAQRTTQQGSLNVIAGIKEDWPALLADTTARMLQNETLPDKGVGLVVGRSSHALHLARNGRVAEAEAVIAATPLDCAPCVANRGRIAAMAGNSALADHWLGEAVRMSPSIPQRPFEWGRVLLDRGDADRAAAKFRLAHEVSPRWADPIAYWGETLLLKGDARGAAAKFKQAAQIAPKWGRNQLLWGEALNRQGKRDEAKAHWREAGTLYLTPAERVRLQALLQ